MELSVILCTYNRSNRLIRTIKSLQSQDLPENFPWGIVVVDNNSTDDTPEKVRGFAKNSELIEPRITMKGYSAALLDDEAYRRSLFGIPLFIFRQLLRCVGNYIFTIFSHGWNKSFRKEMNIWYFLGHMQAKINQFKKSSLT